MRLLVIEQQSGTEQHYELRGRAITLDFDETGVLRPLASRSALRIETRGRNVLLTDLGMDEPVHLGSLPLAPQTPTIWLAHQEVRLGNYLLFLQSTGVTWRQRLATWTADRVAPLLILLLIGLLLWGLFTAGRTLWRQQQSALRQGSFLASWLPPYSGALAWHPPDTPMPTATATATTVTPTITPTQIITVTPVYIRPTATPTATATLSVTATATATTIGGADALSVAITHTMTPEIWDSRLITLEVTVAPAVLPIGQPFWRLIEGRWLDEAESNGLHHVFIEVVDQHKQRYLNPPPTVRMIWTTGVCERQIDNDNPYWVGDRAYGAHCPMYNAGKVYQIKVDGLPSDVVKNVGLGALGEQRTWDIRTSFLFVFQYTIHRREEE